MSEMMGMLMMSTRCSSISIAKAQLSGTSSIVELSIFPLVGDRDGDKPIVMTTVSG